MKQLPQTGTAALLEVLSHTWMMVLSMISFHARDDKVGTLILIQPNYFVCCFCSC